MSIAGSNLPFFKSVQLDFAAHIRNPAVHAVPEGVEPRRMQIYADLFFNNIRGFIDGTFPVSAQIIGEERWLGLVREFIHHHGCESPYFLQVCEEFLAFLYQRGLQDLPGFLLELCHYEWVELALDVAPDEPAEVVLQPVDELSGRLALNPVVRSLAYEYPVHQIGPAHQPVGPPPQPTYLIAYRNAQLQVRFMSSNPLTHRLLELLQTLDVQVALVQIHEELCDAGQIVSLDQVTSQGKQVLRQLQHNGIILGQVSG